MSDAFHAKVAAAAAAERRAIAGGIFRLAELAFLIAILVRVW